MSNVYMVLAALGRAGKGGAVVNRASMFARAGHHVTIVVLNYQPSLNKNIERYRAAGRFHPDVKVINLFEALSGAIDSRAPRSIFRWIRGSGRTFSGPAPDRDVARAEGSVVGRDSEGRIVRLRDYEHGLITADRYFTPRGRLYVRRVYKVGRSAAVDAYDPSTRTLKRYNGYWRWQAKWLAKLVEDDDEPPVIVCDSQAKMAPMLTHVRQELATRIGVLHGNHFNEAPYALGAAVKPNDHRFLDRLGELDALVTLTQSQADDIAEKYGNADRIQVIPNVVENFRPVDVGDREERVTIFSRLTAGKRIGDAIEAFNQVIEVIPGATLDIYGQGRDRAKLQKLIDDEGLAETVKFRGYSMKVHEEMAASAATVFASDSEGMGMAIAESMMAGTPVIAYDVNYGPSDLINDGVDGILVPHADIDALSSSIVELLQDPERAKEMGLRGREKMQHDYSEHVVMSKWEELLDQVQRPGNQPRLRTRTNPILGRRPNGPPLRKWSRWSWCR